METPAAPKQAPCPQPPLKLPSEPRLSFPLWPPREPRKASPAYRRRSPSLLLFPPPPPSPPPPPADRSLPALTMAAALGRGGPEGATPQPPANCDRGPGLIRHRLRQDQLSREERRAPRPNLVSSRERRGDKLSPGGCRESGRAQDCQSSAPPPRAPCLWCSDEGRASLAAGTTQVAVFML